MPSSTAALVAFNASVTRSFFSFTSTSLAPPICNSGYANVRTAQNVKVNAERALIVFKHHTVGQTIKYRIEIHQNIITFEDVHMVHQFIYIIWTD